MLIAPDVRSIEVSQAPDAVDVAKRAVVARRSNDIVLARALTEVRRKRSYVYYGCASAAQFGQRLGLAAPEAYMLLDLGRVLEIDPSIEDRLRRGVMTTAAAAAICRLLANPGLADEHADWVERAMHESLSSLRRGVRRRIAEMRCGEPVVDLTVHVTESVSEGFRRARHIASEKAQRVLSRSEAFELVVDHYLDTFDPERKQERPRRVGPTSERPHDRYIPRAVRRAVRRRAGDTCEFPGCNHRAFLQFAHWRPHRGRSPREEEDLLLLCHIHHLLVDGKFFALLGSPLDPTFIDPLGTVFDADSAGGRNPGSEAEHQALRDLRRRGDPKDEH